MGLDFFSPFFLRLGANEPLSRYRTAVQHYLHINRFNHGTYIRWYLTKSTLGMFVGKQAFGETKKSTCDCMTSIKTNALNRSDNRDHSTSAHLFLSYHLI